MVILTLVKKDLKITLKSPFTLVFKALLVLFVIFTCLIKDIGNLKLKDPVPPEILTSTPKIAVGIIGEESFKTIAEQSGATVKKHFEDREAFDKFMKEEENSQFGYNFIQIAQKEGKRQYNFTLSNISKPLTAEQTNWFSTVTTEEPSLDSSKQENINNLAVLATKIEESFSSSRISVSFIKGGQSSTFALKDPELIMNAFPIIFFFCLLFLLLEYVKEEKVRRANLIYRQGVTPFQMLFSKILFGFVFLSPFYCFSLWFFIKYFSYGIPAWIWLILTTNIVLLIILSSYLVSFAFNSLKTFNLFAALLLFSYITARYGYTANLFWWGLIYLMQFFPMVNVLLLVNHVFNLAVTY